MIFLLVSLTTVEGEMFPLQLQVSYHIGDMRDGLGTRSLGISTVTTERQGSEKLPGAVPAIRLEDIAIMGNRKEELNRFLTRILEFDSKPLAGKSARR